MADVFDVIVVGGGISGLTTATILKKKGINVLLVEPNLCPGGSIVTWKKDGFLFELGPNTVLGNCPEIDELLSLAGLLEKKITASPDSKKRYIVRRGKLLALPLGPLSFTFGGAFSLKAKLRLLKEPFIPAPPPEVEETVAAFTIRRLGKEFLDYAVGPFVSGVYAGDPYKLSLAHAVPKIAALEIKYGSLIKGAISKRKGGQPAGSLISFRNGLQVLPETLGSLLGGSLLPSSRALAVSRDGVFFSVKVKLMTGLTENLKSRSVVMAVPAEEASSLLSTFRGPFAEGISTLPYAPVAVVSMGFKRRDIKNPLKGFGFLAPEVEDRFVLGCLFSSSLFPERAPSGYVALTAFVGGAIHPERALMNEDKIVSETLSDISPLLGIDAGPTLVRVTVWEKAIPQYLLGHKAYKSAGEQFEEEHKGIFISGNLLNGVSVGNCIQNATNTAHDVADFIQKDKSGGIINP
jgi:protoporphyrinogen/coproporphyrinogen III oxidase